MPEPNLNLLEWYAAHRGEVDVLRDPSALFALGLLDHVGETSRGALQNDLGVEPGALDTIIEKLYAAGFVATRGATLAVTPSGSQFLTEIGLRGPLPPPTGNQNTPETPNPPTPLPKRMPLKPAATPAPRIPLWLWVLIGVSIIGITLVFGVLLRDPGAQPPTPLPVQTVTEQPAPPTRLPIQTVTEQPAPPTRLPIRTATGRFVSPAPTAHEVADSTPTTFIAPAAEIVFKVEPRSISPGACAILTWQVSNAREVFMDAQPVKERARTRVCPKETTTYTLTVLALNGEKLVQTIELAVAQPESNYVWTIVGKDAPFDNVRLQIAIASAVDEPAIAKAVLQGAGSLYNTDPKLDEIEYDWGRSLELSKETKYDGQPIFIVPDRDRTSAAVASAIAEYLQAANFQVRLVNVESRATILVGPER